MWTDEQITLFFEGVQRFDRSFDAMATSIKSKTENQIRRYYYKMARRIRDHLNKSKAEKSVVIEPNTVNERRAIICYWELRKKLIKVGAKKDVTVITDDKLLHKWVLFVLSLVKKRSQSSSRSFFSFHLALILSRHFVKLLHELYSKGTVIFRKNNKNVTVQFKDKAKKSIVPNIADDGGRIWWREQLLRPEIMYSAPGTPNDLKTIYLQFLIFVTENIFSFTLSKHFSVYLFLHLTSSFTLSSYSSLVFIFNFATNFTSS